MIVPSPPSRGAFVVALLAAVSASGVSQPRSVTFTTTEGTWVSLDVAPDGQTIVFELLALPTDPLNAGLTIFQPCLSMSMTTSSARSATPR